MVVDRAIANEAALSAYLAELLGAQITQVTVIQTDFVLDKTIVDVTYRLATGSPTEAVTSAEAGSSQGEHAPLS